MQQRECSLYTGRRYYENTTAGLHMKRILELELSIDNKLQWQPDCREFFMNIFNPGLDYGDLHLNILILPLCLHYKEYDVTKIRRSSKGHNDEQASIPRLLTLMAHLPIARTDLRTKSTSTSVAYLTQKSRLVAGG